MIPTRHTDGRLPTSFQKEISKKGRSNGGSKVSQANIIKRIVWLIPGLKQGVLSLKFQAAACFKLIYITCKLSTLFKYS